MASFGGISNKKDLNFELNLMPVFDILSVCICFLLMTVVWVEVRSIETSQAVGGQSLAETKPEKSLWIKIDDAQNLDLSFNDSQQKTDTRISIKAKESTINWKEVNRFIMAQKSKVSLAHLLPSKNTKYDEIIRLMDLLKQNGFQNVGLSPI
ncbi:MAG: biopolymer transporter ExbD [Bdellovibrionaceae bacterium]|nr:biopolymer transporter ExbD [Pseudobdellovibrionaceae bacterium]NUM58162.1 biopolymer transporter ExbD [Pseudobdellovibrionaceae bacterium]